LSGRGGTLGLGLGGPDPAASANGGRPDDEFAEKHPRRFARMLLDGYVCGDEMVMDVELALAMATGFWEGDAKLSAAKQALEDLEETGASSAQKVALDDDARASVGIKARSAAVPALEAAKHELYRAESTFILIVDAVEELRRDLEAGLLEEEADEREASEAAKRGALNMALQSGEDKGGAGGAGGGGGAQGRQLSKLARKFKDRAAAAAKMMRAVSSMTSLSQEAAEGKRRQGLSVGRQAFGSSVDPVAAAKRDVASVRSLERIYFNGERIKEAERVMQVLSADEEAMPAQRLMRQRLFGDASSIVTRARAVYQVAGEPLREAKATAALELINTLHNYETAAHEKRFEEAVSYLEECVSLAAGLPKLPPVPLVVATSKGLSHDGGILGLPLRPLAVVQRRAIINGVSDGADAQACLDAHDYDGCRNAIQRARASFEWFKEAKAPEKAPTAAPKEEEPGGGRAKEEEPPKDDEMEEMIASGDRAAAQVEALAVAVEAAHAEARADAALWHALQAVEGAGLESSALTTPQLQALMQQRRRFAKLNPLLPKKPRPDKRKQLEEERQREEEEEAAAAKAAAGKSKGTRSRR